MANIQKSKLSTKQTRKTKAVRQAGFRQKAAAAGRARWEVLVSGSEKTELKKLLAAIRKATTGSTPAPATGSTLLPPKPATTGSAPAATTGSTLLPPKAATTGSVPAPATGSAQKATTGSA